MGGWGVTRTVDKTRILTTDDNDRARRKEQELVDRWVLPDKPKKKIKDGELDLPADLRVGIIGAGFAGVAAGWYLHELGVECVVYEFSDHVGGRVLTDPKFIPGKNTESGAELIGTNHPMWRNLARRKKLALRLLTFEEDYKKEKLKVRLRFGSKELTDAEKEKVKKDIVPVLDRMGAEAKDISQFAPWDSKGAAAFDNKSLSQRFDELDMFGPTRPFSLARELLEFKIGNDNCASPKNLSYLGMLCAVSAGRMDDTAEGLRGYWDFTETHRCAPDGNQALAKKLADELGGRVRLSAPVRKVEIVKTASGIRPVVVETKAGKRDDFDYVILTAPATVWGSIVFDPPFDKRARSLSHGDAVKYMSRWPDEFWKGLGFAPSALWDQLGSVWETTDRQPRDPPRPPDFGLTVFSGGTFVLPKIDDYRRQLAVLYPNPKPAKDELLLEWPKVAGILAGYAVPTVGQVTTVMKLLSQPHLGRIFFAGEQVSAGFYGYMEGALQSGGTAARDVILRAAKVHPTVVPGHPPPPTPAPAPPVTPPQPPPPKAGTILAEIKRLGGADYVVAQLDRLLPGPAPTIGTIAETLHLRPDVVFHDLLGYRANAPAVIGLFRDQIEEPVPADLEEARRRLRVAGTQFTANALFPEGSETPYVAWPVEPDQNKPVVLPLSAGYRRVLDEATRKRQRQTRLEAIQPQLDALAAENRAIRDAAQALTDDIELARVVGQRNAQDVALLEALDGLLGAMLAAPKARPDPSDRRDVEELRRRLDTLRAEAHRHMLLDPVDVFEAGVVARRDREASALVGLVEADAFVEHTRTLAANRDIAPAELYRDTLETVGFALQSLLASPASDGVVERHVLPMIDVIAAQSVDLTGVAARLNADLDRAIRTVPAPKPAKSVLEILVVGAAGMVPQADTLAVGVLQWAAPHILGRVASDPAAATAMAGRLYRFIVNCASICEPVPGVPARPLSMAERVALLEAIDQGNLARLREVHWSARLGSSASWAWVLAVCNLVCFLAAVKEDGDASTLRSWANILGTGAGAAFSVAVAVQRWSTLVQQGIVRGPGGRALGVIGGAAAVVSGVVTAVEEEESGDRVGMWVAIGGATGGALSVAGLLVGTGAATTATVLGAPVGVVLIVAGAVLGIGTGVVALVRALTTEGSQVVFEAVLTQFNRVAGPFRDAAAVRPSLQAAFTAVQEGHHPVDFWDVDPDKCPQLSDLGFAPALIAHVVDASEAEVTTRLRQGEREAGPVPVGVP